MRYLLLLVLLVGISCSPQQIGERLFKSHFKDKYAKFLEEDERVLSERFHYVESVNSTGSYVRRVFFPETLQITSELMYSDPKMEILDGPAKFWHETGQLKAVGQYRMNKGDGSWTRYDRHSGSVIEKGIYNNGIKTGQWISYDSKGRIENKWLFTKGLKEGPFEAYDSLSNLISTGTYRADTLYEVTYLGSDNDRELVEVEQTMPYLASCNGISDKDARNKCSTEALLKYIYRHLKYPGYAREYGLQGKTITQFVVEKDGSISDVDIVVGICQGFKDEIEKVIKGMPRWEAGVQDGKTARVKYTIPISFKLH